MLKYIFNPVVTAFAAQSSVATLPVNMEACKKIGVPDDISNKDWLDKRIANGQVEVQL